jgi:hypothetical protein
LCRGDGVRRLTPLVIAHSLEQALSATRLPWPSGFPGRVLFEFVCAETGSRYNGAAPSPSTDTEAGELRWRTRRRTRRPAPSRAGP